MDREGTDYVCPAWSFWAPAGWDAGSAGFPFGGRIGGVEEVGGIVFEPAADGGFLLVVDVGVDVHGDLDGGVAELRLDVFEVELVGGFHAAGHVVAQHVEGGPYAELLAVGVVEGGEVGGVDP